MLMFKEIYNYRQMISSMVRKDLRGRYKGSVLGFLWTFINPLLQLVVYNMVFSIILRNNIEKFYLYLFVALIPWIFFSASLTGGSVSIISQKDLVKKIYFPREVIPISYVTSSFVNMLLSFVVVIAVVLFAGVRPDPLGIICLPVIMLVEYVLCLGMAMITSAVTVYFRDLEHILGIIAMAWMYLTPIVYSEDMCPERYRVFLHLNPMTSIVAGYRDVLYWGTVPKLATLGEALLLGIVFLVIGCLVFGRLKKHFAEEL
ncbi:MAG: ABC transporter permease [Clostridiales bacterium]|nr:ABC transporter permease [Clostridiales bacterium]